MAEISTGKELRRIVYPEWLIESDIYCDLTRNMPTAPGHESRASHFRKYVSEIWGREDSIFPFEWNPNAIKMLDAKMEHRFLTISGPGGCSKTQWLAIWLVCNFLFFPRDVKALVTSLTLKAAKGKVWGAIAECWQQVCRYMAKGMGMPITKGESLLPGKLLSQGLIRYDYRGMSTERAGLELVPGDASRAKDSAEKIQGYHRGAIFAGLDELASLNHALCKTIESHIFTNWQADVTGTFNCDSHFDPGGIYSQPVEGWKSLKPKADGWKTKHGYHLAFYGSTSPNVVAQARLWNGLLSYEAYEDAKVKLGPESKEFCKSYEGVYCPTGSLENIYDEADIINREADKNTKADDATRKAWLEPPTPCAGLDASYGHGGDRAIAYFGLCGRARINGEVIKLLYATEYIRLDAKLETTRSKDEQVVANFIRECKARAVNPRNAGMDTSGAGGPLYTLIARDWSPEILQVNFGSMASDLPVSGLDRTPCRERYRLMVDELWYQPKHLLRASQLRGLHPDLIIEMCARTFEEAAGKISVESKEKMKDRTTRSPDIADAYFVMVHTAQRRMSLVASGKANYANPLSRQQQTDRSVMQKKILEAVRPGMSFQSGKGGVLWNR